MIFRKHSDLEGQHAFLSASSYHWVNYDIEKLTDVYYTAKAKQKGTELHELASSCIKHGRKQAGRDTFSLFVNDAIKLGMESEQVLFYSFNCFGTADAISFRNKTLRIHDLKTGTTTAHFMQLRIYAALFCLEYDTKPGDISIELRIYQNDEVRIEEPDTDDIAHIMDTIISFDKHIKKLQEE